MTMSGTEPTRFLNLDLDLQGDAGLDDLLVALSTPLGP